MNLKNFKIDFKNKKRLIPQVLTIAFIFFSLVLTVSCNNHSKVVDSDNSSPALYDNQVLVPLPPGNFDY